MTLKDLRQNAFLEVQRGSDEIEEWLHVRQVEVEALAQTSTVRSLSWSVAEPYLQAEVDRIKEFFLFQIVRPDGSFSIQKLGNQIKILRIETSFKKQLQARAIFLIPSSAVLQEFF